MTTKELCACGRPLHYTDKRLELAVRRLVEVLGPTVKVRVLGKPSTVWLVPRHYIALHGIKAAELARLGFVKIESARAAP